MSSIVLKPALASYRPVGVISGTYNLSSGNASTNTSYSAGKVSLVFSTWYGSLVQQASAKYNSTNKNLTLSNPGYSYTMVNTVVNTLTGSSFSFTVNSSSGSRSFSHTNPGGAGVYLPTPNTNLLIPNGVGTITIGFAYNGGSGTTINIKGQQQFTGYVTANRGLFTAPNILSLLGKITINSIVLNQTTPSGTVVKWFFTLNGGTNWKYLNAGVPTNISLSLANLNTYGNTKAQIEAYLNNHDVSAGETALGFASQLSTTNSANTPTINNIQYNVLAYL